MDCEQYSVLLRQGPEDLLHVVYEPDNVWSSGTFLQLSGLRLWDLLLVPTVSPLTSSSSSELMSWKPLCC